MSISSRRNAKRVAVRALRGFTMVELLVSATLLIIIIGIVLQITNQTSQIWRSSNARIQAFQEARAGFEAMTRKLGQATLNTYYDYYDANNLSRSQMTTAAKLAGFVPVRYDRASDLHFISGRADTLLKQCPQPITTQTHGVFFQAPLGYSVDYQVMDNAINACGYFLQFDDAAATVPEYVKLSPNYKPRFRYRLMEMMQRTEQLEIFYDPSSSALPGPNEWFVKNVSANSRIVADNVITLALLPRLPSREDDPANSSGKGVSLAPNYNYNTRVPVGATTDVTWSGAEPPFPGDRFTAHPVNSSAVTASRHHQLPPLMRVVMVVIDESSAARLHGNASTVPEAIDLAGTELFKDASRLDSDIQAVEDICNARPGNITGNKQKLVYRVFNTDLIMREAKWSND